MDPSDPFFEKADVETRDAEGVEYDFSGEQKHRSYRGVRFASSSSFTQSFVPVCRALSFKRTEGSGVGDV